VLVKSGMNVKLVQARMGHQSATITLDIYAHLWPADADLGRNVVSGRTLSSILAASSSTGACLSGYRR
jgi:hypothetical protein